MLERTDAITNEVLEPITFVLAYPTVYIYIYIYIYIITLRMTRNSQVSVMNRLRNGGPGFDYHHRQKAFFSVNLPDSLGGATSLSPSLLRLRMSSAIPLCAGRGQSV